MPVVILLIAILFIIGLITYLIDSLYNGVMFLGVFFLNSFWGLATIISGAITGILFYASGRTYIDSKVKESFLPNINKLKTKSNSITKMDKNKDLTQNKNVNEIDLSHVTLQGLVGQMAYLTTKPGPVFFKGWGNRRIELDIERVRLIRNYIDEVRAAGSSLTEFQADAVLSFEKVKALTEIKHNDLKTQVQESKLKLDLVTEKYNSEIENLKLDLKHKQTDLNKKEMEIEEMKFKIKERERELAMKEKLNDVKAKVLEMKMTDDSAFSKSRTGLLDTIIEEMDMNNINPSQAFVLINALSPGTIEDINFQTRAEMVKEELEKMKAERKYKSAEALEKEAEAKERSAQSKANIHDLNNPYA